MIQALDLKIREGQPQVLMFHGTMDDPTTNDGGPQWFEAMKAILDYLKAKQAAGDVEVMSFANYAKLFVPELFQSPKQVS